MVKPIQSGAPQPIPESPKKVPTPPNNAQPIETTVVQKTVGYNDAGRTARRAERSMEGQAQAAKLFAQLQHASVPTPYPNIANANQKDDSKK